MQKEPKTELEMYLALQKKIIAHLGQNTLMGKMFLEFLDNKDIEDLYRNYLQK